ncbi:pyridoxamine kinase [Ruminococcus sp.]|uniref:pyridoxamine kinase n=1 Tax=Ruminococcus sp. TaxID=41978 RepID=UPI001B672507|nr:pyridoxamine kinase [Ruminococcus sp.]MBP5433381.1 pyridoxamine kinase [Ruminococcus sp.]
MKKIVTIQDISCFGKCSLTVALPIISAMGIETAVIPTAVLSTHTGEGFKNYTFRDLTSDIPSIAAHWKSMDLNFDALYTGYLGSPEQVDIVSNFFDDFGTNENRIIVDPVLGDAGRLYAGFTKSFVEKMKKLCARADYIMPNMTEVSFLLDIPYTETYSEEYVMDVLRRLAELGCKTPVITGVHYDDIKQGAAAYNSENDRFYFSFDKNINYRFHGTGDIFSSVFTGACTLGMDIQQCLDIAVKFTLDCIEATIPHIDETWYGSCFELCLGKLIGYVKEK